MKKVYTLCICLFICGLAGNRIYAQGGTNSTPWPGAPLTYSLGAGTDDGNFTWWVSTSSTSKQPSDAGTLAYGATGYTISGYNSGYPQDVPNLKSITIQWGSGIGSYPVLYVFVQAKNATCSNIRYFTVTPVNDFNASVVDVTKANSPTTATGPAVTNGSECPDETGLVTETSSYNAGYTTYTFRVDRKLSMNPWSFGYKISATTADGTNLASKIANVSAVGSSTTPTGLSATGTINGTAGDNYFVFTFQVANQPGKVVSATFSINGAKDVSTSKSDSKTTDDSATHSIQAMPAIGAFN